MKKNYLVFLFFFILHTSLFGATYSSAFSISNASITEGNSGTTYLTFTVTISGYCRKNTTYTVNWATADGTATTANGDYAAQSGTVTYTQGNYNTSAGTICGTQTISVPIYGDTTYENDEYFYVNLSNPTSTSPTYTATITTNQATGTILNDDAAPFSTSNTRDFTLVSGFPYNIKGDIQIIGNSVTLKSGGVCPENNENNNNFDIVYADMDGNSFSTFDSSSADIQLPKGVTKIKYAGLYWQGRTQTTTKLAEAITAKIRFPNDSNYHTVTTDSSKFNWYTETGVSVSSTGNLYSYQGVTDVTSLLQADINATYSSIINSTGYSATVWVGDVVTDVGAGIRINGYGSWALVVVYEDAAGTLRNISLYDGFRLLKVNNYQTPHINETLTQTLSGFYTPPSGAVNSKFLFFGGEGDAGDYPTIANYGYNDYASLSNSSGVDVSLGSDVFNGTETDSNGNNITTRNPACINTIGTDIHTYDVGTSSTKYPIIGNSQSSTTIKLTPDTNEDSYSPGVFAFATDIYTPKLCYVENIYKGNELISGENVQVNSDENLTVRVYVTNTDNAAAEKVQILHQFDSSFPYVASSTNYNNSNPAFQTTMPPTYTRTSATDSSGDDLFEYNSTSLLAKINLGTNATSTSGGTFSENNTTTAVFEYNATVKTTQTYSNIYQVAYKNSALGIDYSNSPVTISSCDGTANSFFGYTYTSQGSIDAVDNYATNGYTVAMGLQTKIANKNGYTFNPVWLGTGSTPTTYTGTRPIPIRISLSDNTCSTDEDLAQTTGYVEAIIPINSISGTSSSFTIVNKAKKVSKLRFRYIDWSNLPGGNYSQCLSSSSTLSALEGVPACLNSDSKIVKAFGQAIATQCANTGSRPACQSNSYSNGLPSAPYDNALGCFICLADALNGAVCSTDNFAIRPNDFNSTITSNQQFIADKNSSITFYANQYNGTGTNDYNETMNSSFKVDINISDTSKTCPISTISISPTVSFSNGLATNTYSLPNVGDFNLTIHEIPGAEYAIIDADDTPDSTRYISPYTQQITVVPDHFLVEGNLTNGSNGFTYLSNFETYPNTPDRNISAKLDLNITAKSFLNNTTSNYTNLCYAKDGNITLATNTTGSNLSGLSKLLWYDAKHDLNGSVPLIASSSYVMDLNKTQFDSATTNGMSESQYLINFNRAINQTVDPFTFLVTTVSTKNEDNRTGSLGLNQNALYYYGRVYSTDYRGKSPIPATIRYEAYCGSNCSTFGLTTQSPLSVTWYQNPLHVTSDGNVTQFSSVGTTQIKGADTATSGTITMGLETAALSNNNVPYVDRIQMTPSAWLIYNAANAGATSNDFNVEFINTGNWSGEGTVDRNDSTHDVGAFSNDHNVTRSTRKMNW